MKAEILYMLGIVAAGFAVNYALRAIPFLLFAGKDREIPKWITRFGDLVSPVIIAALIVYSYSGLQWKTAWITTPRNNAVHSSRRYFNSFN